MSRDEGFRLRPVLESVEGFPAREDDICVAFGGAKNLHVYKAGHSINGPITFRKGLLEILLAPTGYRDTIHDDYHWLTSHSRPATGGKKGFCLAISAGICST